MNDVNIQEEEFEVEIATVEIPVAAKTYGLANGLVDMVDAIGEALENGWQTGEDLPVVISSVVEDLVPHISGVTELDDEWKADRQATMNALYTAFSRLV